MKKIVTKLASVLGYGVLIALAVFFLVALIAIIILAIYEFKK